MTQPYDVAHLLLPLVCPLGEQSAYARSRTHCNDCVNADLTVKNRPEYRSFPHLTYPCTARFLDFSTSCIVGSCPDSTGGVRQ